MMWLSPRTMGESVERFWLSGGSRPEPLLREVPPDGNVDLLFQLSRGRCRIHLFGPATRPMLVSGDRGDAFVGIRFLPGRAPRLADVTHADLLDSHFVLDRVFGAGADELGERLSRLVARPRADLAGKALEALLRRGDRRPMAGPVCFRAAQAASTLRGRVSVEGLAGLAGVSRRGLERAFVSQLGLRPKLFLRLMRLQRALEGLGLPGRGHADLAAACGFSDQAHMVREFRALAGRTPVDMARFLRVNAFLDTPPPGAVVFAMD